jgi:chemotaxis response regulator CheB
MTTRIAIISGSSERRAAIKAQVTQVRHANIAGEIGENAALRLLTTLAPDLVLIDAATVGVNPIAVLHMPLSAPVIVLAATEHTSEHQLFRELGARAVVAPSQFESLAGCISTTAGEANGTQTLPLRSAQPLRRRWLRPVNILTRH